MDEEKIKEEINQLEAEMSSIDFWQDKVRAQLVIKKISELKNKLLGSKKYDKGNCILSILSGAGGDDAEDFSAMLFRMYTKYFSKVGFSYSVISENKNSLGGYRNISIEVVGKNAYGTLKNESGVHRLIRQSPFNAKSLRQTSFSLVEVIPGFEKDDKEIEISDDDLKIEYSKSGGPGGQNVNKRETAVRVIHLPTNTSIHVTSERSQEQNKETVMMLLNHLKKINLHFKNFYFIFAFYNYLRSSKNGRLYILEEIIHRNGVLELIEIIEIIQD